LKTPLEKAKYDCKIEASRILNAGLGLFASEAKKEGDTFGHYWGKINFLDQVPDKNSGRYMMTTKYLPKPRRMILRGSAGSCTLMVSKRALLDMSTTLH
jgi:hypothetical protein